MQYNEKRTFINQYEIIIADLILVIWLSITMILTCVELHVIWGVIVGICCMVVLLVILPIVVYMGKIEVTNEGLIIRKKLYYWSDIINVYMPYGGTITFPKFVLKGEKKNKKITLSTRAFDKIKARTNSEKLLKMMADADIRF